MTSFPTDLDECVSSEFNDCSDICINTNGSYSCDCSEGFSLNIDGKTCTGISIFCNMTTINTSLFL